MGLQGWSKIMNATAPGRLLSQCTSTSTLRQAVRKKNGRSIYELGHTPEVCFAVARRRPPSMRIVSSSSFIIHVLRVWPFPHPSVFARRRPLSCAFLQHSPLSSAFIRFHPFSSDFMHFRPFSSVFVLFRPFSYVVHVFRTNYTTVPRC